MVFFVVSIPFLSWVPHAPPLHAPLLLPQATVFAVEDDSRQSAMDALFSAAKAQQSATEALGESWEDSELRHSISAPVACHRAACSVAP
eukprot:4424384-Prymnesium_polylepis.1